LPRLSHDAGPIRRRSEWNEFNVSAMMGVTLHPSRCAGRPPLSAVLAGLELVNAMPYKHSANVSQLVLVVSLTIAVSP
jgi:hypothetical protein